MNFVNLRKSTVFAFILLFALTAAFADKARFYQNGYWKPQKKYTWLAGFIDFEKLRAFN